MRKIWCIRKILASESSFVFSRGFRSMNRFSKNLCDMNKSRIEYCFPLDSEISSMKGIFYRYNYNKYNQHNRYHNHQQSSFLFLFGISGVIGLVTYRILEIIFLKKAKPEKRFSRSLRKEESLLKSMKNSHSELSSKMKSTNADFESLLHEYFSQNELVMKKYSRFLKSKQELYENHKILKKSYEVYKKRLLLARQKFSETYPDKFEELKNLYYLEFQNAHNNYQKFLHRHRFDRDSFYSEILDFYNQSKTEHRSKINQKFVELENLLNQMESDVNDNLKLIQGNDEADKLFIDDLETYWRRKNRELRDLEYLGWKIPSPSKFREYVSQYWYLLAFAFIFISSIGVKD